MLKLGFSLNNSTYKNQLGNMLDDSKYHCSGLWIQELSTKPEGSRYQHFSRVDDLIGCSEAIVIASNNDSKFDIASKSIKKGVVPIFNDIQGLSASSLNQLQQLAIEMGITIGFNQLGCNYNNLTLPQESPFIAHLKRSIDSVSFNSENFKEILLFDLASALKLSKLDIRKIRAYGLPSGASTPSNVLVLIDFCNNSVVTYSLLTNCNNNSLDIQLFTENSNLNYTFTNDIDTHCSTPGCKTSLDHCINSISKGVKISENIELAIATALAAETVLSKINP